jgi:hypothetical protein
LGTSENSQSISAGDPRGMEFVLSGLSQYPTTVDVFVKDYVTGEDV